jgi:uncharacterized protein YkwD
MSKLHHAKSLAATFIAAWALVACGGSNSTNDGSNTGNAGGSSGNTPSTGFSGQDASAPKLINNIATDGLNWINYRRSQVGMSTLTRNGRIDIAAQGHSDYQRINNIVSHEEVPGKQGYTGTILQDRLAAASYVIQTPNAIGEVISATNNASGFYMAEELITAIYHRFVIFEPVFREIGTGAASTSASPAYNYFTADFATSGGYGAGLAAGTLATWPFNGQTGVTRNFFSNLEEPDPVPDQNEVGYPVSVHTNLTRVLTVQSFTMRARGATANLNTRLLVQGQDANMKNNRSAAAIVPLAPLAASTTYDITFIGAIDGTQISRTWSFTTAAQ